jgi:hypothetical protein
MSNEESYTYGNNQVIQLILLAICIVIATFLLVNAKFEPGDWIYLLLMSPIALFAAYLSLVIWLDVVVTDEGICKPFYGFRGVFVSWDAIKSARFVRRKEGGWMYILFTSSHPSLGTLRFTSAIGNAGHLVERVNEELLRRNVPIRTWKGSTLVAAERLPPPSDAYPT